jgi:hypothetical protein
LHVHYLKMLRKSEMTEKMKAFCSLVGEFKLGNPTYSTKYQPAINWSSDKCQNWESIEGLLQLMMLHFEGIHLTVLIRFTIYVEYAFPCSIVYKNPVMNEMVKCHHYNVVAEVCRCGDFNYGLRERLRSDYDQVIKNINGLVELMHEDSDLEFTNPNEEPTRIKFNGIHEFGIHIYRKLTRSDSD